MLSEAAFQKQVIQLAQTYGWHVAHFKTAPTQAGRWATPVAADGKGFPDLVLVRERVIYAELKSLKGKLRMEQAVWLAKLSEAGSEVYVWKPEDLDVIQDVLCSKRPALTLAV